MAFQSIFGTPKGQKQFQAAVTKQPETTSPLRAKISQLQSKVSAYSSNIVEDRAAKLSQIDSNISNLEQSLVELEHQRETKAALLREDVDRILDSYNKHLLLSRELNESMNEKCLRLEEAVQIELQEQMQESEQSIADVVRSGEEQLDLRGREIAETLNITKEKLRSNFNDILAQIPQLEQLMLKERAEEQQFIRELDDRMRNEIEKLKQTIEDEEKQHAQMIQNAQNEMQVFVELAQKKLSEEKKQRVETQRDLMELWKKTCAKLIEARSF
ncbi:MAG: hypothetical protein EZS28_005751 [Streblomastix strix]|uniref:Uncharacterized protein n=1 Tax=Streblomastix strix TaxID=222440 RepID=A0A5J4WW50_9EUKA|nr:MAG: hypothetical protein EZS28_005751 [Streblomastix strix]